MLSRVADSLYWLGRYSERTETNAHILDLQLEQMLERSATDPAACDEWRMIISICGYIEDFGARYGKFDDIAQLAHYMIQDPKNFNAIGQLITYIRANARNARDIIPNDLWVNWNELYLNYQDQQVNIDNKQHIASYLAEVRKTALITTGVVDSLMTRDEGFLFIKIGKWIERSEKTALIVSHLLEQDNELIRDFRANFALQLTNAHEEYTRRFRLRESDEVLNFLMGDLKCSRSVAYGVRKIKDSIADIEGKEMRPYAEKMVQAIESIEQLLQQDAKLLTVIERKKWVNEIRQQCTDFGPLFSQTYYLTKPILI